MMTADDVVDVLSLVDHTVVTYWIDGGWGIDALLGVQSRDHTDLDLVVRRVDVAALLDSLGTQGFVVVRDWQPTAIALRDTSGREVDLHPIDPTDDGGGDQLLDGGLTWHYGPPTLGRIAGRSVSCCPPLDQVATHLGYEPRSTDREDLQRLADRFGLTLPAPYGPGPIPSATGP